MQQQQLVIQNCPRCGQSHPVNATPYADQQKSAPFTHWYLCDVCGEPASINLTVEAAGVPLDQEVVQQLSSAQQSGKYMVAVWQIVDGKILAPFWKTQSYPRGDIMPSLEMLTKSLQDQAQQLPPPSPLPEAMPTPLGGGGFPPAHLMPQSVVVDSPAMPENLPQPDVVDEAKPASEAKESPQFDNENANKNDVW